MILKIKLLLALSSLFLLSACKSEPADEKPVQQVQPTEYVELTSKKLTEATMVKNIKSVEAVKMKELQNPQLGWQQGKIQFVNVEGGFYGLITYSGQKLLLLNLAAKFRQNGAIVRVKGKIKNVMSIQQWGRPFTITDIEIISAGNAAVNKHH